jgi:tRNA(Ile)-lysidine synthase
LAQLEPNSCVLVACSGGADSVALAAALAFEAPRAGIRAGAVTVDHGLQAGSATRASSVVRLMADLGLDPVESVAVEVAGPGGPEAAARAARYAALDAVAQRCGAVAALLGHTLDDQAETVLLGLARGSGLRSIAGMPATAGENGRYRRPLLGLSKATTRAACADQGLPVWDDPHNVDPSFARVRVRTSVLPVLESALGPGVAEALARTAQLARDDADALDHWAALAHAEVAGAGPDGIDIADLERLPAAVRTRVLRLAAIGAGVAAGDLSSAHIAAIDALITDWHGQGAASLPGAFCASRRYGRLYLHRLGDEQARGSAGG